MQKAGQRQTNTVRLHLYQESRVIRDRKYNDGCQGLGERRLELLSNGYGDSVAAILTFVFISLGHAGSSLWCAGSRYSMRAWLWHVGSGSLARDFSQTPCFGNAESQALNYQGSCEIKFYKIKKFWRLASHQCKYTLYYSTLKNIQMVVFPWWSSGQDYMLPMQGVWVQSLVRELRSHMHQGQKKKKIKKKKKNLDGTTFLMVW